MKRIASIDIFRAITMLLMVFVNDLWTLHDIPHWLEHTTAQEDAMGLSDIIFPVFLFIAGLSIPFAIKTRIEKAEKKLLILQHILRRSFALIVMGFFFVNHEYYRQDVSFFIRNTWQVAMVFSFILIWNNYEKTDTFEKLPIRMLQACGIFMLIILAIIYKGGLPDDPQWMSPHWWGILGLIGWAYLLCSLVYLVSRDKLWIIAGFLLILHALNAQEFRPIAGIFGFRLIVSASNYALVMSGMFATSIYLKLRNSDRKFLFPFMLLIPAMLCIAYGFEVRPLWGISKILATPSWTAICAGISFLCFALIYVISDIFNHTRWTLWIMPAGRNALTCYMLPGIFYAIFFQQLTNLPEFISGGIAGILKSLFFALTIVIIAGGLEKIKISIKL